KCIEAIHELFFQNKNVLTRGNREAFIEIFTQFLILKCIDILEPDFVSFTCKDANDVGMAESALFYGFVKLLYSDFTKKEAQDFLRWLLYMPALVHRERAIDSERLARAIGALEKVDETMAERGKDVVKGMSGLFGPKTIEVKE